MPYIIGAIVIFILACLAIGIVLWALALVLRYLTLPLACVFATLMISELIKGKRRKNNDLIITSIVLIPILFFGFWGGGKLLNWLNSSSNKNEAKNTTTVETKSDTNKQSKNKSANDEAKAKVDAEAKAKADAEVKAKSEAEAKADAEAKQNQWVRAPGNIYVGVKMYYGIGNEKMYVGQVLASNDKHYDSYTGKSFRGVQLQMASGSIEWKDRDAMIANGQWYVKENDPALQAAR